MICRDLHIPKYGWHVKLYYAVTCYHTADIIENLEEIECPEEFCRKAFDNLSSCQLNNGITYSNSRLRRSVVVIGLHSSPTEFLNSLMHELRHLEDHIMVALSMEPGGEEIAYLAGDIGGDLVEDVAMFICDCHCHEHDLEDVLYQQNKTKQHDYKSRFKDRGCPSCDGGR